MASMRLGRFAAAALLVAVGVAWGSVLDRPNEALGEVRSTPPPASFQTGGQLSLPVLKEIATTLHQIDARLARLEAAAQKMGSARPAGPANIGVR